MYLPRTVNLFHPTGSKEMIYFVWTGKAVQDRGAEFREFVNGMVKVLQKYVSDDLISCEKVLNMTGNRTQAHVVCKYRSLSAKDSVDAKFAKDKDWLALMKKNTDLPNPIAQASGQFYRVEEVD